MANEQQPQAGYTKDSELVQRITGEAMLMLPAELRAAIDHRAASERFAKILNAATPRQWTAEDVSDEQVDLVFRKEWGSDESDRWREAAKGMIAAACNIMSAPKPQPVAVDVERLAKAVCDAIWGGVVLCSDEVKVVDVLRRELSQQKAAASEWPADAPEWADRLYSDSGGVIVWAIGLLHPRQRSGNSFAGGVRREKYTGPRPASWAGKPWTECVLRRPGGGA